MRRRVAILGSTGSIGTAAIDVLRHLRDEFEIAALSAHRCVDQLIAQAAELRPAAVALTSAIDDRDRSKLSGLAAAVHTGTTALAEIVSRDDVDVVLLAVVGAAGLPAAMRCVSLGKTLLLANKESLVVAGELLLAEAARSGATILPIDSEHGALHQAMRAGRRDEIDRLILTASGGPFRTWSAERIAAATVEDALNHPTWRMGGKITIDSATMFNKSLEVIEAARLFSFPPERIDVIVHPQSVVHSMVRFVDGSIVAQASPPDMRMPIQYALCYPNRRPGPAAAVDFSRPQAWTFEPPDFEKFPALRIGFDVARAAGTAGATMNAANEVAVEAFLGRAIAFGKIAEIVDRTLNAHPPRPASTTDELLRADADARAFARSVL